MNTAAPTPWQFTGSSIVDAEGRLVCVLAQRHQQDGIVDAICAAPEMVEALADLIRSLTHPDGEDWPELAAARAVLAKARGTP